MRNREEARRGAEETDSGILPEPDQVSVQINIRYNNDLTSGSSLEEHYAGNAEQEELEAECCSEEEGQVGEERLEEELRVFVKSSMRKSKTEGSARTSGPRGKIWRATDCGGEEGRDERVWREKRAPEEKGGHQGGGI